MIVPLPRRLLDPPKAMASPLLSLPAEVRLEILNYCVTPPYPPREIVERYRSVQPDASFANNVQLQKPHHSIWPFYPTYKSRADRRPAYVRPQCEHPKVHLSLLHVCRQLHQEFWPVFASIHTWHFANPLKFANQFLSRLPPQRLGDIKHLRLSLSREPIRLGIDGACWISDVRQNIRNLGRLWKLYPEIQENLEELEIECVGYYYSNFLGGDTGHVDLLFQVLIEMLESQNHFKEHDGNDQNWTDNADSTAFEAESGEQSDSTLPKEVASKDTCLEQRRDNTYLIWISRKEVNVPFITNSQPVLIHVTPMPKKNWNKLLNYSVVQSGTHVEATSSSLSSFTNSLIDYRLKKKFWKIATMKQSSHYDMETGSQRYARNWKVIFADLDYTTPGVWMNALESLRLKQAKQDLSRLTRSTKSKRKAKTVTSDAAAETLSKSVSSPRKRSKRKR